LRSRTPSPYSGGTPTSVRVLVVDDYEPWRHFVSTTLQNQPELQVIGEAWDGLEAVQKAQQLKPDLILLDVGLPTLNGIESARRIRAVSPDSKILFLSENRSWDIAEEALRAGGGGYLVKSDSASELLPAIKAVLQGKQFVSPSLAGNNFSEPSNDHIFDTPALKELVTPPPQALEIVRHEVGLYSDDRWLLDDMTQFIGVALKNGNAAVVVATESHRNRLLPRLQANGLDVDAAIEQGRYIALDAADTLSIYMVHGMPDSFRFLNAFGKLIDKAAKATQGEHPRVRVFGESAPFLWAQGNVAAAIQMEKLTNQLTTSYAVDILCGYCLGSVHDATKSHTFQRICAEHSVVHSR
jgi:DNA-binding NarL/FixJ family response regulator